MGDRSPKRETVWENFVCLGDRLSPYRVSVWGSQTFDFRAFMAFMAVKIVEKLKTGKIVTIVKITSHCIFGYPTAL